MTNVAPLHQMTLAEAQAQELAQAREWLASINYRPDWTAEEFRAAIEGMDDHSLDRLEHALNVCAEAAKREASALRAYAAHRAVAE